VALRLLLVVLVVGVLGGLGTWAYYAWTVPAPTSGGRYVEAVLGQPNTLNPLLVDYDNGDREFMPLLFAGLTRAGADGVVAPELAESWTMSPDGRVYTFTLRPRLRWSDGAALEAADVAFTYAALRAADFPADPDSLRVWRDVAVDTPDASTVRFTLARPWGGFLQAASLGIVPRHALAGASGRAWLTHPFNEQPVGAGPYRVRDFEGGDLVLEPNPYYHGPKPYLTELRFRGYGSPQAAQDALLGGAVDGVALRGTRLPLALETNPELAVHAVPDYARNTTLWLNTAAAPFDDRAVRAAAALAIDRERLVRELPGAAQPARGPLPPTAWAYAAETSWPAFAPDRARALLESAGWRASQGGERARNGVPLAFTIATNDDPARRAAAEAVARDLRAVGFQAQVTVRDWPSLAREELAQRRFQAVVLGQWLPVADPSVLDDVWRSDGVANLAGWRNERADDLLAQGRLAVGIDERRALYAAFQQVWAAEAPSIPLYYPSLTWVVRTSLHGVDLSALPDGSQRLALLPTWYTHTTRVFRGW
jgi:peptide/nickel transport system substrate-binding protein